MQETNEKNNKNDNSLKLIRLSFIKETNEKEGLKNTHLSDQTKRIPSNNNWIPQIEKIENNIVNRRSEFLNNNNNFGFIPRFGKGFHKDRSNSNKNLNNIQNNDIINNMKIKNRLSSTILNNINFGFNNQSDDSLDNEKNLKKVENQIKSKIMDMSCTVISDNRSFIKKN